MYLLVDRGLSRLQSRNYIGNRSDGRTIPGVDDDASAGALQHIRGEEGHISGFQEQGIDVTRLDRHCNALPGQT